MSVVASKRNVTKFDYYDTAMHLRYVITRFLMCNFGNSKSYKDITFFAKQNKILDDDRIILENIFSKYGKDLTIQTSFPEWSIEHMRNRLTYFLDKLLEAVVNIETIYPATMNLFNLKQRYVAEAINACENIINEFQFMAIMFHNAGVDLSAFDPYLDETNALIEKLKDVRSRNNSYKVYATQREIESSNKAMFYIKNGVYVFNEDGTLKTADRYKKDVADFNKANSELVNNFNISNKAFSNTIDSDHIITLSTQEDDQIVHPTFSSNIILPDPSIEISSNIPQDPALLNNPYVEDMIHEGNHWHMAGTVLDENSNWVFNNMTCSYSGMQPIYPAAIFC